MEVPDGAKLADGDAIADDIGAGPQIPIRARLKVYCVTLSLVGRRDSATVGFVAKVDTTIHSLLKLSMNLRLTLNISTNYNLNRFSALKVVSRRCGSARELVRATLRLLQKLELIVSGPAAGAMDK